MNSTTEVERLFFKKKKKTLSARLSIERLENSQVIS